MNAIPTICRTLHYNNMSLKLGRQTLIMGILNATPDSFSDGGMYNSIQGALHRVRQMIKDGADIIDVGGESTRPGADQIAAEEELQRVIPIIEAIAREVDIPVSIDTYKAEVARQALEAGAHLINDVWGLQADPRMAAIAADYGCPIIVMHNRKNREYKDFLQDVKADLLASVGLAKEKGVRDEYIILDPGIGFAKSYQQNLYLLNHLEGMTELGYPLLLGTSRKSVIRHTLNLPADDVVEGTAATTALGIMKGCQIIRVHDVAQMKRVAQMTDAILHTKQPE